MANDRDCENCKHHKEVCKDGIFYYSCDLWDCEFEPCEPVRNPDQLDCVNRQAVLDTLENMDRALDEDRTVESYKELLRECYKVLPSVSSSEKPRLIDPAYEKTLNKWIGAEVLDRIRNEMHATAEKHEDGVYYLRDEWVDEIIDKYMAEGSE